MIRLCSTDGDTFEVDIAVARMSMTIRAMLEDLGSNNNDEEMIKVPRVNSKILRLILDWARHHVNDKPTEIVYDDELDAPEVSRRSDDIEEWDLEFLKPLDNSDVFELVTAANYLHIKGLLVLTSKAIANMIRGKSPSQIRKVFNIGACDGSAPPSGSACVEVDDDSESE